MRVSLYPVTDDCESMKIWSQIGRILYCTISFHTTMEVESGVTHGQMKECWGRPLPPGRSKEGPPPRNFGERLSYTLVSDFWLPEVVEHEFLFF